MDNVVVDISEQKKKWIVSWNVWSQPRVKQFYNITPKEYIRSRTTQQTITLHGVIIFLVIIILRYTHPVNLSDTNMSRDKFIVL